MSEWVSEWVRNQKNPTSQIQRDTLIYFHTSFTFRSRAVGKLNRVFHDEQHRSNWNMKLDDVWEIEMRNSSFLFLRRRLSVFRRRLKIDVDLSNVIWCPPTREFIDEIVQTSSSENRRKTRSDVVYFFWWTPGLIVYILNGAPIESTFSHTSTLSNINSHLHSHSYKSDTPTLSHLHSYWA